MGDWNSSITSAWLHRHCSQFGIGIVVSSAENRIEGELKDMRIFMP